MKSTKEFWTTTDIFNTVSMCIYELYGFIKSEEEEEEREQMKSTKEFWTTAAGVNRSNNNSLEEWLLSRQAHQQHNQQQLSPVRRPRARYLLFYTYNNYYDNISPWAFLHTSMNYEIVAGTELELHLFGIR
jgi:hypothetical protein